jgi:hypothetical protein
MQITTKTPTVDINANTPENKLRVYALSPGSPGKGPGAFGACAKIELEKSTKNENNRIIPTKENPFNESTSIAPRVFKPSPRTGICEIFILSSKPFFFLHETPFSLTEVLG